MNNSSIDQGPPRARIGAFALALMGVSLGASKAQATVVLSLSSVSASGPSTAPSGGTYTYNPSDFSFTSSPITDGIQMVGTFHTTGSEFLNSSVPIGYNGGNFIFSGPATGVVDAGDEMFTNYNFSYTISGGQVVFYTTEELLQNGDGSTISGGESFGYGGPPTSPTGPFTYQINGGVITSPATLVNATWLSEFGLDWTGFSPSDTLTLNVTSVDTTIVQEPIPSVPEPATATIVLASAAGLFMRHRRRL